MKFERFIATFVMMNIVLMIAVVFTAKDKIFMETTSQILFAEKVTPEFFTLPPDKLDSHGFVNGSKSALIDTAEDIFKNSHFGADDINQIADLSPYEKSVSLIKMFSLMGDGKCLAGKTSGEKIKAMASKNGCAKDFAEIFAVLAEYSGIKVRIVSNGLHFANEIFDGDKWIYIDPYFAMSVSSETGYMSYKQFSEAMINDGWMRFNYFGGEEHCMSGKPIAEHPYFGDKYAFAALYMYNGNNFAEIIDLERELSGKALFKRKLIPYKNNTPQLVYTEIADSNESIIRKYVATALAVIAAIFAGTNIALPVYFLTGLFRRFSSRK